MNVVKGIPPQMLPGHKLNLVPFVQLLMENAFGSRLSSQIFENVKDKLAVPPVMEFKLLGMGFALSVHEMDDDKEHMEAHIQLAQEKGDPTGAAQEHIYYHRMQMNQKLQMEAASGAAMMRGTPGGPGGAGPGVAGTPREGAQPGAARGGQNPPGAIHQDRLAGPDVAPRR